MHIGIIKINDYHIIISYACGIIIHMYYRLKKKKEKGKIKNV